MTKTRYDKTHTTKHSFQLFDNQLVTDFQFLIFNFLTHDN